MHLSDNDRKNLDKKLSIVIEEGRHHDQLCTHTWVGGIITLGIYLVVLDSVVKATESPFQNRV